MAVSKCNEVNCRVASAADFPAIMALGEDLAGGVDYLPAMYFHWLHDPRYKLVVAEHNDKVVGFYMVRVLAPNLISGRAARIHKAYQSQGLSAILYYNWMVFLKESHPPDLRVMSSWSQVSRDKTYAYVRRVPHWRFSHEYSFIAYRTMASSVKDEVFLDVPGVSQEFKSTSHATLQEVMQPQNVTQLQNILMKLGHLICFAPHPVLPASPHYIREAVQLCTTVWTSNMVQKSRQISAFSLSSCLQVKPGHVRVDISIYSDNLQVPASLAHIKLHLERAIPFCKEQMLTIVLYLPDYFKLNNIAPYLEGNLGERLTHPPYDESGSRGLVGSFVIHTSKL